MLHETSWRVDANAALLDLALIDHTLDPTVVVYMGMGVDHRFYRQPTYVCSIKIQRRLGRFLGYQGVDNDQPSSGLDDGHVRQVQATHLVHMLCHLEEPRDAVQALLPP
uniref:Uncharacterized protein n=1 Tax=Xanthomonas citri pv. phaseoli var. fuscans TaxID=473423 RepID=A0AB33FAB8_XANCI